ncbi:MAG: BCCT family transporter [Corynebacterium sp.]|nr:BCCT family transporter [Corynebacterium sp.]
MLDQKHEIPADNALGGGDYVYDEDHPNVDWKVVGPTIAIILAVVVWGLASPTTFTDYVATALAWIVDSFGWAFVLFSTMFLVCILCIAASRFGNIRLGGDQEGPEFSTPSWIAMMFAAGMGIGLMFYGTTEPLTFFRNGVPSHGSGEVSTAFAQTLFHWTLHPWAIYAIVGLAIAYSTYRMGRKQLISSAFTPLIGEKRADGWLGRIIDILSIIATVFGTAASLGIGATQISAGLDRSGLVKDPSMNVIICIVLVLTFAFVLSAVSGVGKGIQYVSNANMVMAAVLAIFVFLLGPTVNILNILPTALGGYFQEFFEMASRTSDSNGENVGGWLSSWTIFYWAWWISWSPFVGMFLARISRGRTIREFIVGVTIVPSILSLVWFSIFGGTAVHLERVGESIWGEGDSRSQLFDLLHTLPAGFIAGIVAMVLLATFFITSADSASAVMGTLSQHGRLDPSGWVAAFWGLSTAAIGITLLLTGGSASLNNLQYMTIIVASPFLLIIIGLMVALVKGLREDPIYLDHREQQRFAMQLARERRIHAEAVRREWKKHHHWD